MSHVSCVPHRSALRLAPLAMLIGVAAPAQCLDWMDGLEESEGGASSHVSSVAEGTLGGARVAFVGGWYQRIGGMTSKGLAAWDGQTWTPLDQWFQGWVSDLAWFDDGPGPALFAIGGFYVEDGAPRTNVLRYRDGQWDDLHAETGNQDSYSAIVHDGMLFISGGFTSVAGQPTNGLAAWDGASWHAFPAAPDGPVWAMASHDDGNGPALILGGAFSSAGGVAAANVAMYRDGVWTAMGPGLTGGQCQALCAVPEWNGSALYAGGSFLWSGNDRATHIARWNGTTWARLGGNAADGGGTNDPVQALGVLPGRFFSELVVAGTFDGTNGGPDVRGIAAWSGSDSAWRDLRAGIGATQVRVATGVNTDAGVRVIAGGGIGDQGGKPAKNIAIWGVPCSAPKVIDSPQSKTAPYDDFVEFTVHAHGSLPMEYVWAKDGVPLTADSRIKGVDSTRLTISPWNYGDGGVYECWVLNEFGFGISAPALLTIPGGNLPPLPIDTLTPTEIESFTQQGRTIGLSATSVAPDGGIAIHAGGYGERHILAWRDGALERIASVGDPLPGALFDETLSVLAPRPVAGRTGMVVFAAEITGPEVEPTDDSAMLLYDGMTLRTIFREGDPAPGMPDGVLFAHVGDQSSAAFGDDGGLFLVNRIAGPGYDPNYDGALLKWSSDEGLELIAASHQTAPGGDIAWTWMDGGTVPGAAGYAFVAAGLDSTTGYKNFPYPDRGLWLESGTGLAPVAKSGDQAPGFPADVNFEIFKDPAALPNRLCFSSRVAGPDGFDSFGLWSWDGASVQKVVIAGDPVPPGPPEGPPDGVFVWPDVLRGNRNDALLFMSAIESPCAPDCANNGAFLHTPDVALRAIAYNHAPPLPGMDDVLTIDYFPSHLLNPRNQVVIETGLNTYLGLRGLLGWDPLRGLFPIIVPGTRIETEPGLTRVVLRATLARSDEPDPITTTGLDDDGMLTSVIEFTDWPGAIVRTSWAGARDAYFPCRADFNDDGSVDTRDVVRFLNLWAVKDWAADFSDDGRVDTTDVIAFLNAWVSACL